MIASGIVYQNFYRPAEIAPIKASGRIVNVDMRVLKDKWVWSPDTISAKAGDHVILTIFNEDDYDHGFALEAFGVNKRLYPNQSTKIEFDVSKVGTFGFYCSVPCGEGHYQQVGGFTGEKEEVSYEHSHDHGGALTGSFVVTQ